MIGLPDRLRRTRWRAPEPRRAGRWGLVGLFVVGVATLAVGITRWSSAVAVLGLVLALPQTAEAVLGLVGRQETLGDGLDRAALARRMLATRRSEKVTPSIPGGVAVDLDYLAETELVTFRSQDDEVATFDELVATLTGTGGPLVLVGAPGSGKTFTARRVVTTLLEQAAAGDGPLAERFQLARWDGQPLADWLADEWARRRESCLGRGDARRLIDDPSTVLVLDGLDEVPHARRQMCVDAINAFVDVRPAARLVVCCRNREYRALARRVESRRARWIAPLGVETIAAFVSTHGPGGWDRVRGQLAGDQALRALLSTPLMLVAALRAFRDDPTPLLAGSLIERQHALWDGYVERMLRTGDRSPVPFADQRRWLEDIAVTMAATGTLELGRVPRRLQAFVDRCVARHLLRRSAGGYQCIHRQLLGHLVAGCDLVTEARPLRTRLLARVPSEAQAWGNLAHEALAAGHADAAARLSRRTVEIEPDSPRFLADHAFHLLVALRLDEAAAVARAAEAADPEDWRPASTLAYALYALGDIEGSAAARRRAWAKGHRQSDGTFLSWVLTLQGLRDEACAIFDRLRAIDDDANRMDQALALKALGRAGEAVDSLFLPDADQVNAGIASFIVPATVARSLVSEAAIELVEPEPGRARLIIFMADHIHDAAGVYGQLTIMLSARPVGTDRHPPGSFTLHRFVNQSLGHRLGEGTLALPSAIAELGIEYAADSVTFRLWVGEHPTLTVCMPRAPVSGVVRRELCSYAVVGDIPVVSTGFFDMPARIADTTTVTVDLGTGPVADMLRRLGLPRSPDYCTWGEGLSLSRGLPRPLKRS